MLSHSLWPGANTRRRWWGGGRVGTYEAASWAKSAICCLDALSSVPVVHHPSPHAPPCMPTIHRKPAAPPLCSYLSCLAWGRPGFQNGGVDWMPLAAQKNIMMKQLAATTAHPTPRFVWVPRGLGSGNQKCCRALEKPGCPLSAVVAYIPALDSSSPFPPPPKAQYTQGSSPASLHTSQPCPFPASAWSAWTRPPWASRNASGTLWASCPRA